MIGMQVPWRRISIVAVLMILSPLQYLSGGSPGTVFREEDAEQDTIGFHFLLDEGNGQIAHNMLSDQPFSEGSGSENAHLGSSISKDQYDPEWTSNTRNGYALQFFEGDRLTYPKDPSIGISSFTFMISIFPYNTRDESAVFCFEDSDNELNGLFIVDGSLETRWHGGKKLHGNIDIEPGNWYDIAITWSPPFEEIHVNGLLMDRCHWDFFTPSVSDMKEINFGVLIDGSGYRDPFTGMMDGIYLESGVGDPGGTIGSWNFQGSSDYIPDRSGYDNHGSLISSSGPVDEVPLSEGINGQCLDLSGGDSFVDCGSLRNVLSPFGNMWSVSMWIKPGSMNEEKSPNNITNTFLSYASPFEDDPYIFEFGLDNECRLMYFISSGGEGSRVENMGTSSSSLVMDRWTNLFLSITEDEGISTLMVEMDGVERIVETGPLSGTVIPLKDCSCNFTIGGSFLSRFDGMVDDVVLSTSSRNPFAGKNGSFYKFDSDGSDNGMFTDRDLRSNNIVFGSDNVKFGEKSAYFDGSSSFIFHEQPGIFLSGDLSVGFWACPETMDDFCVLFEMTEDDGSEMISLSMDPDGYLLLSVLLGDGSDTYPVNISSRGNLTAGRWTHVGFSCSYGTLSLYLNGMTDNRTGSDLNGMGLAIGDGMLMIGASRGTPATDHFHGYMDVLTISDNIQGMDRDSDGDCMSDCYEIMRSSDSDIMDPLQANGRYALLIGNNDQRSDKNVGYASANDARDVRYHLRSLGWNDHDMTVLFHRENILASSYGNTSYIDGTPSRSDVTEGFEFLASISGPYDLVMVLYSGHGDQLPDVDEDEDNYDFGSSGKNMSKQDEQLALSDRLDGDPDQLSDDNYTRLALEVKAGQMIHIIVSCNSGGFLEDIKQGFEGADEKPWGRYSVITACHENDVAYVKDRESSFLAQSLFDKAMMGIDRDQWGDREAYGRCDWNPDVDVTLNNMMFMEQDGVAEDLPTRTDDPPHWQRNHYTEEGYQPGFENGKSGQDFPDQGFRWGETDRATMYVTSLQYSPSNGNGIVDVEEAFYFSVHNEYLGEGTINPEADPDATTDLGDDPLIFDSDPEYLHKIYL